MVVTMASGFGILLVLVGTLLAVIGFQTISDCSRTFSYFQQYCWNPFQGTFAEHDYSAGIFAFYAGSVMAALGTTLLLGGYVGRRLGWWI